MVEPTIDAGVCFGVEEELEVDVRPGPDGRVPAEQVYALLETIREREEGDTVGLDLEPQLTSEAITAILEHFRAFDSLAEVYEFLEDSYHLVMNGQRIRHRSHGHLHVCELVLHGRPRPGHEVFADFSLAGAKRLFPRFLEEGFEPLKICLRRSEPSDGPRHAEMFDCPIEYDHPANMNVFGNQAVAKTADESRENAGQRLLDELAPRREDSPEPSIIERVEELTTSGELGLDPALEDVAAELHTSPRTVQRKLRRAGVSFRLLRKERLASVASEMLLDGVSQQDVSERLGYSEPASFARAFHRWLGLYPNAFLELNESLGSHG